MTTEESLPELQRRLAAAGWDDERPDLAVLWGVYREWALNPVEGVNAERESDMLLFECSLQLREAGKYEFGPSFIVGFTRQYSFEDEQGDDDGMEHVGADLRFAVHDDFRAVTRMRNERFGTADQFWGNGGPAAAEWIAYVEASRAFTTALGHQCIAAEPFHTPV